MNPFNITREIAGFCNPHPSGDEFTHFWRKATFTERHGIVRQWLTEGIPFAFKKCPMLYEAIREWFGSKMQIHPKYITLVGSARLGFSLAPLPRFGKSYDDKSDLDISIISNELFCECANAFQLWSDDYKNRRIAPRHEKEKTYWDSNLDTVPINIERGFIDHWKIPTFQKYKIAQYIENTRWLLQKILRETSSSPNFKKISLRIYGNWQACIRQLTINVNYVVEQINEYNIS